jgi:3-phosphoshikimate 1-carboxyvinyltransferase
VSAARPIELRVPGDKSISHRALILATLAQGESRIIGILGAGDPRSTAGVLRALGCAVPELPEAGGEIRVAGDGLRGWRRPAVDLDCGNSGTTARLLLGALAGVPLEARLTGDASLSSRPMRRVTEPLRWLGATFREEGDGGRLPLTVLGGGLHGGRHASTIASAQVKSALLLAGLTAGVPVRVSEPHLSRDHTERMLEALGVPLRRSSNGVGASVALEPVDRIAPLDVRVPGDFSSAAFLIVAALLTGRPAVIRGVGVNPTRAGMLAVLARMGARIGVDATGAAAGEPVADLTVEPSVLRGTTIEAAEIPSLIDEIPAIGVLAARADGETRIEGAAELRVKESDRITAIVANLNSIGGVAEELPDGFVVHGGRRPLHGRIATLHDHRIAMAFGALGLAAGCLIEIDAPGTADVSFPGYWALLAAFRGARVHA